MLAQLDRRPIGGEDQLPALAEQGVDGVHQFDLRGPLSDQELQIVEDQHAHATILAAKDRHSAAPQGLEELAGELFGGEIDGRRASARLPLGRPDPFQQMRLADAGGTVNEQRRDLPRIASDHLGGKLGQPIALADDEGRERSEFSREGGGRRRLRLPGHSRGAGRFARCRYGRRIVFVLTVD